MSEDTVVIELNPRERRLYDRLRAQVVAPDPAARSGIRDLLLLLPDLVVLLYRLLRDPRVPAGGKAIAVLGLAYVASPVELLPEAVLGPVGLLDDLLVATAAASRVLNYVHPDVVRSHWPGRGDALRAIQRVSEWSEAQLGGRLRSLSNSLLGMRRGS